VNTLARQTLGPLPIRSIAAITFAGAVAIAALAGCGHIPPQSKEHTSISGVNASVGNIGIRNAQVTTGANGNAIVTLALFNEGSTTDTLTAVSSAAAASGTLPSAEGLDVGTANGVFVTATMNTIVLVALKSSLIGADIPVELSFKFAGTITLQLPIVKNDTALRVGPTPTASTKGAPTPAGTTPTPTATATSVASPSPSTSSSAR
jgi:copper(I)-binding protein